MEKIKLVEYPELIDVWDGKLSNCSFSNLKSLIVEKCDFLSCVIPSYLLNSFCSLEELEVSNCDSVEAVFDLQGINDSYTLPQLQLKSMELRHLPKLKCVWNKNPQQRDFCQHLQNVKAFECGSLRSIFPASIAKHLPKLEWLNIDSCIGVEVIVERDEVAGVAPCFEFPQLHTLWLWKLSNLKNFYSETHTSEWPQLRVLKVYKCPNVEVFGSEIPRTTETHEKDKPEVQRPLFFVEKVVPNLEVLMLNQKAITMIRKYESQVDLLHKVKLLYLESFHDESVTFPYSFLERLPDLKELHVWYSSFEEIFPSQGPTGNNLGKYAPLKILEFFNLEQLKIIWHSDSQVELLLQNLEVLKVRDCSSLINMAPSSASFDSLTKLKVTSCHQLAYLVTSSTAMSLVHLTTLKVRDCKMIEEIVTIKEENVGNAIAMPKLECLELTGLSSMKAFCSFENYSWHFPSLYKVIVRECPRLSMFCTEIVTTPLLMGVEVAENTVYWDDNLNNTVKQLYAEKVAFRSMEKIKFVEYPELIDIWEGRLSNWSFNNLKSLVVENCYFLSQVIPSYILNSLSNLEELEVSNCNSVEAVFDLQDITEPHTLPQLRLKSIKLWNLLKLKCVWNKDPQNGDFCQHLRKVEAYECNSLRSIFPASIAKHLPKLEELDIRCCFGVEVIVERDEVAATSSPCFVFPQLSLLRLWQLRNLKNFYPDRHTCEWPTLRNLGVYLCNNLDVFGTEVSSMINTGGNDEDKTEYPLCLIEKVIPNLEVLVLNQKAVTKIENGQFQEDLFHNVKVLSLESFLDEHVKFPSDFLERFPNAQELYVYACSFDEIFPRQESLGAHTRKTVPVKNLTISFLWKLKNIWNEDHQPEQVLQNLESLKVDDCSALITLAPSSASFYKLTDLEVSGCHGLIYLITSSTAMTLVHLMRLKINNCKMMEEIVTVKEENVGNTIAMQKLECLELTGLSSLKAFCSSCNYTLIFPSLYQVTIRQCPALRMFCPGVLTTPILEGVKAEENKVWWEESLNKTINQLFEDNVAFRSMEKIKLVEYPELIDIWEGRLSNWSFNNLRSLIVENCDFLSYVIPSYILNSLSNLEELEVSNCNSVEAVFDLQDITETHTLPQLRLKSMKLWNLLELKCVWNKNICRSDFCQHLQKLNAFECRSLRSIFPASIAKHLPKLEELYIACCSGVEVIVERDELATTVGPCFVFPQLSLLRLWQLRNLKHFYPDRHTCEWPQLRKLEVLFCNNLDVFGTEVSSMIKTGGNDEDKTEYPLCLIEKVIPNLEVLVLNQKAVRKIENDQFQEDLFHNVKVLLLESFLDEHVKFPSDFLERFPNAQELYVYTCSFEEIFPRQVSLGAHTRKFVPVKNLTISFLSKLKNIWNEDHQSEQVFQNLASLKVTNCDALITLAPSSASFDNLTDLEVSGCHGLIYLITSSTAMTLVHLMRLKINDCKMMEEIVTVKEENVVNTIAMQKLECLELTGLSSLKAFCSSCNYALIFPSLYQVTLRQCPKLRMFCPGVLTTPILKGVKAEENNVWWEESLDKTINQLFKDKIAFRNMEKIKLVEYPELIDMWEGKLSNWSFSNLKSLIVDNCDFLSYVIPSYLLNLLSNLEELEVSNCNSVEAVFDLQDMKEPHALPQLQLKNIDLWRLPKLKSVWNKDPQQINFCQHLQKVKASECESLSSIFPASIAKYLSKLQELRIIGCVRVEVIVEKDEVAGIAPCFEFPQLHTLELWKLPNLKNFYPERHTSEWPQLRDLKVYMCPNVEVFGSEIPITTETHEKDKLEARHPLFFVEKVVPNLDELVLNQKAATMIRNNQFQVDLFNKVKVLNLESFTDEPVTFPCSFLERFPNLKELLVWNSSFAEIFPSQGATGSNLVKYAPIKILDLAYLEQLKIIWHSDSQVELLLQNLERLKVKCCSSLIYLAPSSASFDSLRELDVSGSHQLIYLMTSSTTKSLVHLKTLKVNDCKMIEEIIADEGEIEEKEIPLKELECLELTDLPSLKSFCSLDYKFKFQSLNKVEVRGCPNMKKFCSGVLAAPLLQGVRVEENKKHWEGDLNKTIEQLFLKKDGQNSSEG